MNYYLGIDIGATKTAALICDREGNFIAEATGGPGNHESVGFDGMENSVREALSGVLSQSGLRMEQIAGAGFGIAGYDWPTEEVEMRRVIQNLGITSPYKMVNDVVLGLLAGTSEGWGVAVVSGTGCNCRGWDREHKREGRVTGYGILMGEGAGGSELMNRAMQIIGYSWTRRLPPTTLAAALVEWVGAKDFDDLIRGYTEKYYTIGADAAPVVFRVAEQGDPLANQLIEWAGCELGEMANAVIRQLEFENIEFEVALIGSMFKGGEILIDPMRKTIHQLAPKAKLVRVEIKPVIGAVLLGMEAEGLKLTHEERMKIKSVPAG